MPKKTKKEKIIAAYRKQLKLIEQKPDPIRVLPETKKQEKEIDQPKISVINDEDKRIASFFYLDLKKSLILIFIVIALEIVLYFARIIK